MRVLIGLTASVAATISGKMVSALKKSGHEIKVIVTQKTQYFLKYKSVIKDIEIMGIEVIYEEDEWPNDRYYKNQPIPHIDLGKWADIMLIAPITANTLGKIANGICDNLLTCTFYALPLDKKIFIAPAMNTKMWLKPITKLNLKRVIELNNLEVIEPVEKKLACGDTGIGAMAPIENIIAKINIYKNP